MQKNSSSTSKFTHNYTAQTGKPNIWLLSAYRADSHASWANWLTSHSSDIHWHKLELPGRHFRWRIRSNPLSWLDRLPQTQPDLIIATSMVDLATLKGLHPRLANIPAWCYFHENQFAYPESERQFSSIDHQMVQIYSGLSADKLLFNSEFNRISYLEGITTLFHKKPDIDSKSIRKRLEAKSFVLPIPVTPVSPSKEKDYRLIVWNHRWEYDKAPDIFAHTMIELAEKGIDYKLALLGDRSDIVPEPLIQIREKLSHFIIADEKADNETYRRILGRAGIVVSTAIHEFQGLAVLEAASANARPLVPDALCYREQYPETYRYPSGNHRELCNKLTSWLTGNMPEPADVTKWTGPALRSQWNLIFNF